MNSDSAFYIGKTHHVCQDYASHGPGYAIISDGCSSSPDTDWGSRLLTRAAALEIEKAESLWDIADLEVLKEAKKQAKAIKLPETALDATLLFVKVIDDQYRFDCSGDGIFIKIRKDGVLEITQIEYGSNAPYYLNYHSDEVRKKQYQNKFGTLRTIKQYHIKNDLIISSSEEEDEGLYWLREVDSIKDYLAFVVMSDGALSFQQSVITETSKTIVPVKIENLLSELLGFKNYFGSFVQRRVQAFKKECDKRNWFPTDDVSIGAVYCGE